jgi:hypothetical protein
MATYFEIRLYVEGKYGFVPNTSWIAEVNEQCSVPLVRVAVNRLGAERERHNRCPKAKIEPIKEALKHFGMI